MFANDVKLERRVQSQFDHLTLVSGFVDIILLLYSVWLLSTFTLFLPYSEIAKKCSIVVEDSF